MNIVCVEPLGINEKQFVDLRNEFEKQGHSFSFFLDRKEDEGTLIERMHDADIVIISNIKLPQSVLSQCQRLKYLSVAFTGLDHIDLHFCEAHGIKVQNAAGYSTTAVSELAVGLMVDVLRKITELDGTIRKGGTRGMFLGRELRGKTVGVVGTGAIGTATIRLLKAFGCHILAYNRSVHQEVVDLGVQYTDLDTLLRDSDIVTLHVPLTAETKHLISADAISKMKPTAVIINTARGNVCDIDAVASALKDDTIAGAAFDVYENEPPLSNNHPLLNAPNCVCIPHIGYASRESFDIRANIVFDHVREYLQHKNKSHK